MYGLDDPNIEVTLVDRTNHHLFKPLLYRVAVGILPQEDFAEDARRTLQAEIDEVLGEDRAGVGDAAAGDRTPCGVPEVGMGR